MSALSVNPPYPIFTDSDGTPLDNGNIYIGLPNLNPEVNLVQVFWDADLTQPAAQPVKTLAGYPSRQGTPARLYINGNDFSITVRNKKGKVVYTALKSTEVYSAANVSADDGSPGSLWTTVQGFINYVMSPLGTSILGFLQAGAGAVLRNLQSKVRETQISVKDFGAVGDGVANDTEAIVNAIAHAATAVGGSQGAVVYFPTGTYLIGSKIVLPNRVGLQGANGRGVTIKPHSSFTDSFMFHAVNGTSSMFGSWIRDMFIDARGFNMTAPVWSQAWQESCGMERVTLIFDGTTSYGFLYSEGYGGAAYLRFTDCEIFSNSSSATAAGVLIGTISLVGGFVFHWDGGTITGSDTNILPSGIRVSGDSLVADVYHGEYVANMITIGGPGGLSADTITGSFNAVTNIVSLSSNFTGQLSLRNILSNGASGDIVKDNTAALRSISAGSTGLLCSYDRDFSGFSAGLSAQIPNVTGNGTEYTIVFDSEIYDYKSEYVPASGVFTAKRSGKYLFAVCVKLAVTVGITTCVIKLVTSNRTYHLFRGDTDNTYDGSGTLTLNGAVIADMDALDTARVTVIVTGLGANTVDIQPDETFFQGQWLTR